MERYSDLYIQAGIRSGFGSDMLKLQQFKIILNVPPLAAVFDDYVGMPGNRGYHLYSPDWVKEKVLHAVQNGWSVCAHVTGDADTDMVLTAYENALEWYKSETGNDNTMLRLRLEHCTMLNPSLVDRMAAAKIVVNLEPCGKLSPRHAPGGASEKLLGHERWLWSQPTKPLFEAGLNVNFGSDYPMPYGFIDPRAGIYAAIDGCGRPWDAITPYEAVKAYTLNGAYGVFSEDRFGSIEVGKLADLVVFSDNPLTMDKDRIWDAGQNAPAELFIDYTIVGGKIEYMR
jgi:predicted amidohydrolase YtcJ